jgi:hypothetical protein
MQFSSKDHYCICPNVNTDSSNIEENTVNLSFINTDNCNNCNYHIINNDTKLKSLIYNITNIVNKPIIISLPYKLKKLTINAKNNSINILHFPDSLEELYVDCNTLIGKIMHTNIKRLQMIFNTNIKTLKLHDIEEKIKEKIKETNSSFLKLLPENIIELEHNTWNKIIDKYWYFPKTLKSLKIIFNDENKDLLITRLPENLESLTITGKCKKLLLDHSIVPKTIVNLKIDVNEFINNDDDEIKTIYI